MLTPLEFLRLTADPQRWNLLEELGRSDRTVGELVDLVGSPQNLVSYHLGTLRRAGLVSSRRSSADGRDTYYRANVPSYGDYLAKVGASLHGGVRLEQARRHKSYRSRVLFLCTGNSSRSQMAEAIARRVTDGAIDAKSAGSHPKPLHPQAIAVMAERGIDISEQTSKHLSRFVRSRFDRVITLCDKVREVCPEFDGAGSRSHWSMPDPAAEGSKEAFVQVAEELEWRIDLLADELGGRR